MTLRSFTAYAYASPLEQSTHSPITAANDKLLPPAPEEIGTIADEKNKSQRAQTLLVVDAACDMPSEWLSDNHVAVLPIRLGVDDWELIDVHNEFDAREFFRKDLTARGSHASSTPLSPAETREFVQSHLSEEIDFVLQVTIASGRSKIYMNSLAAMHQLTVAHNRVRRSIGNRTPFKTWVVDSETGFTGQGVILAETVRLLKHGLSAAKVALTLETLRSKVHAFMVPKDVYYLYRRAREKGDKSLSWLSYNVAQALEIKPIVHAHGGTTEPVLKVRGHQQALDRIIGIAQRQVMRGLATRAVCVSYAGNLEDVRVMSSYRQLRETCRAEKIELILSTMSMTGGLNVGADAFSIAFACDELDLS